MKYVFAVLAALFYLFALGSCTVAKSSIHEIQGYLIAILGTLFFVGAGIIEAVDRTRAALARAAADAGRAK